MSHAVYGIFERMAYYGISSNLFVYLTKKLHQGTVISSNNVNNWVGTVFMTPILGAYIADAHLGRYWTFVISALIYLSVRHFITWLMNTTMCYNSLIIYRVQLSMIFDVINQYVRSAETKLLICVYRWYYANSLLLVIGRVCVCLHYQFPFQA